MALRADSEEQAPVAELASGPVHAADSRPRPIVVAGSGRSGTTWLLDAIAEANRMRPVFEPLHPYAMSKVGIYAHRFVPEDCAVPGLHAYVSDILAGRFSSLWTDFRVRPDRLWPSSGSFGSASAWRDAARRWKRLGAHYFRYRKSRRYHPPVVKFIRANLMLGWLSANFDAPVVLLVRHPGAVIESRLRLGGEDWQSPELLRLYRSDELLWQSHLRHVADLFARSLSPVEAHTVVWCIENQIPLAEASRHGHVVVFYESLVEHPAQAWSLLMERLALPAVPDSVLLGRPSQQARRNWTRGKRTELAHDWRSRVDKQFLADMQGVLERFGVRAYRADDPMPDTGVAPWPG